MLGAETVISLRPSETSFCNIDLQVPLFGFLEGNKLNDDKACQSPSQDNISLLISSLVDLDLYPGYDVQLTLSRNIRPSPPQRTLIR